MPCEPVREQRVSQSRRQKRFAYHDGAVSIIQELVTKHPDQPNFRYHLGMALLQAGDFAGATREFNAGLSLHPPTELRRNIETALAENR
jgi:Flp pilus assembly protein TadD